MKILFPSIFHIAAQIAVLSVTTPFIYNQALTHHMKNWKMLFLSSIQHKKTICTVLFCFVLLLTFVYYLVYLRKLRTICDEYMFGNNNCTSTVIKKVFGKNLILQSKYIIEFIYALRYAYIKLFHCLYRTLEKSGRYQYFSGVSHRIPETLL